MDHGFRRDDNLTIGIDRMHDIRWIRENPEEFDRGLARRGLAACSKEILALDQGWRAAETRAQEAHARRNQTARDMGILRSISSTTNWLALGPVTLNFLQGSGLNPPT